MKDPASATARPCGGCVIEVGGEFNSKYGSITAALTDGPGARAEGAGGGARAV